jgi:phosphoesterase RecJ-like protein
MKLKKKIISLIKCNNDIALFFHEYPDGDALGSVFGFYSFIKKKYPKKNINIIGIDELDNHYLNKFLKFEPLPNYNDE